MIFNIFWANQLWAQSDGLYEYRKEFTWGINKNSLSGLIGGFTFKFSTSIAERQFRTIGIEIVDLKHPAENKGEPTSNTGQRGIVNGKINYFSPIRVNYGREYLLFKKAQQQGVMINANVSIGPTFGLLTPYYVRSGEPNPSYTRNGSNNAVNPDRAASVFYGLFESSIVPGLHFRNSLLFEFGSYKKNLSGFELGYMFEGFPKEIEILNSTSNRAIFSTVFITIFYGSRK